jgi:hypothetical protein
MSKNDKKKRTTGTIYSSNIKIPDPDKSFNSPTSDYSYSDEDNIDRKLHRRY